MDWATIGQRIFHENDVKTMACMGERWLISGGAEHDISVTDSNWTLAYPISRHCCSVAHESNAGLVLMRHPQFIEIWHRPFPSTAILDDTNDSVWQSSSNNTFNVKPSAGPKKIAQINSRNGSYIFESCITPNGKFVAIADECGVRMLKLDEKIGNSIEKLKSLRPETLIQKFWEEDLNETKTTEDQGWDEEEEEEENRDDNKPKQVTAMLATNTHLYYSKNEFILKRFNFRRKKTEIILRVNNNETHLVALSTNCQIFYTELSRTKTPPVTPNTTPRLRRRLASASFSEGNELSPSALLDEDDEKELMNEIKLGYSVVDCTFVDDQLILFLCAEMPSQLVLYNLTTRNIIQVWGKNDLRMRFNEFLNYLSSALLNQVICVSNKGNARVFSGDWQKGQITMKVKKGRAFQIKKQNSEVNSASIPNGHINGTASLSNGIIKTHINGDLNAASGQITKAHHHRNEWRIGLDERLEPFWGFTLNKKVEASKETGSRKRANSKTSNTITPKNEIKTILLVGQKPEALPTQMPMKIRRFDRN